MPHVSSSQCSPAYVIRASFFVGASNGRKLVAIIALCHRVIGSGSLRSGAFPKLTGYGGGPCG